MAKLKWFIFLVPFLLAGAFSQRAASAGRGAPVLVDEVHGAPQRLDVVLSADRAPALGERATLTLEATPLADLPDLQVQWVVPEGVTLHGAATDSAGAVTEGRTVSSRREVTFATPGIHRIIAEAFYGKASARRGVSGVLFFEVAAGRGYASDRDLALIAQKDEMPVRASRRPGAAESSCVTVEGRITRIDLPLATSTDEEGRTIVEGAGEPVRVPVAHAQVELREADLFFDDLVFSMVTDEEGHYKHTHCGGDGFFDDELEIYVRVHAALYDEDGRPVTSVWKRGFLSTTYKQDTGVHSVQGDETLQLDVELNDFWSGIFNMAGAIWDARVFWNDNGGDADDGELFDKAVLIRWEADGRRAYTSAGPRGLQVSGDPSQSDQWDDPVIMMEFTALADNEYSCNASGGNNTLKTVWVIHWESGYGLFFQAAARAARGDAAGWIFADLNAAGEPAHVSDLEHPRDDGGVEFDHDVASALWDLADATDDGQDAVSHGFSLPQEVFTDDEFARRSPYRCTLETYLRTWEETNRPAGRAEAAAIEQNVGEVVFAGVVPGAAASAGDSPAPLAHQQREPQPGENYQWWEQLRFVVDNSQSMGDQGEIAAVETAIEGQIANTLAAEAPVEFSLDTFGGERQTLFAGQFFPGGAAPDLDIPIEGNSEAFCPAFGLRALANAADGEQGGQAWLFTDGDEFGFPEAATVQQLLVQKNIRGSIALLGGCADSAAAEEPSAGILPYLRTALFSGGQFLYVSPDQVDGGSVQDLADILLAQMAHSAGAGRWSDYVSDRATYRYDALTGDEYQWYEASDGAALAIPGDFGSGEYETIVALAGFPFYDREFYYLRVYQNGYLTTDNDDWAEPDNEPIPYGAFPNDAIFAFWDDLAEDTVCDDVNCSSYSDLYWDYEGDWVVVQFDKFALAPQSTSGLDPDLSFQIQLNQETGEIRYLYKSVPDDSGATIGVEEEGGANGEQIAYNEAGKAEPGTGYKLTPAPAQPSQRYTVTVDAHMEGVAFLLTGYNGAFDPLEVHAPGGALISCADTANVVCENVGLVQYVQVDVDGRTGEWTATVSGNGTFSFNSLATSAISPHSPGDHTLPTGEATSLQVDLGQESDDGTLTGWFQSLEGEPFGAPFTLADDGENGDEVAGDGLFTSGAFTPPGAGTAFLWVEGSAGGEPFVRNEQRAFSFQPFSLSAPDEIAYYGRQRAVPFYLHNDDDEAHCYELDIRTPPGWGYNYSAGEFSPCLEAGETATILPEIEMSAGDLPSGSSGLVTLSATDETGTLFDSASALVTRRRPPAEIRVYNPADYLRPNGSDQVTIQFEVLDEQGAPVAEGALLYLSSDLGTIAPFPYGQVQGGIVEATLTAGASEGTATVRAETLNALVVTTTVPIGAPRGRTVQLAVGDSSLEAGESTTLTAIVRDPWDNPVAGETVRIGVEGDGLYGALDGGQEVIAGTTNANGRLQATFTAAGRFGQVGVRAEMLDGADGAEAIYVDRKQIEVGPAARIWLPVIVR